MKVAVISDTHDRLDYIGKVVEEINKEDVSLTIHCGDFISPFSLKELKKLNSDFIGVFGNNDGEILGLLKASNFSIFKPPYEFVFGGMNFVVMHEPLFVESLASSGKFDFILYGHTHEVEVKKVGSSTIINPGEVCGYITGNPTFAILYPQFREVEIRKVRSGNQQSY